MDISRALRKKHERWYLDMKQNSSVMTSPQRAICLPQGAWGSKRNPSSGAAVRWLCHA